MQRNKAKNKSGQQQILNINIGGQPVAVNGQPVTTDATQAVPSTKRPSIEAELSDAVKDYESSKKRSKVELPADLTVIPPKLLAAKTPEGIAKLSGWLEKSATSIDKLNEGKSLDKFGSKRPRLGKGDFPPKPVLAGKPFTTGNALNPTDVNSLYMQKLLTQGKSGDFGVLGGAQRYGAGWNMLTGGFQNFSQDPSVINATNMMLTGIATKFVSMMPGAFKLPVAVVAAALSSMYYALTQTEAGRATWAGMTQYWEKMVTGYTWQTPSAGTPPEYWLVAEQTAQAIQGSVAGCFPRDPNAPKEIANAALAAGIAWYGKNTDVNYTNTQTTKFTASSEIAKQISLQMADSAYASIMAQGDQLKPCAEKVKAAAILAGETAFQTPITPEGSAGMDIPPEPARLKPVDNDGDKATVEEIQSAITAWENYIATIDRIRGEAFGADGIRERQRIEDAAGKVVGEYKARLAAKNITPPPTEPPTTEPPTTQPPTTPVTEPPTTQPPTTEPPTQPPTTQPTTTPVTEPPTTQPPTTQPSTEPPTQPTPDVTIPDLTGPFTIAQVKEAVSRSAKYLSPDSKADQDQVMEGASEYLRTKRPNAKTLTGDEAEYTIMKGVGNLSYLTFFIFKPVGLKQEAVNVGKQYLISIQESSQPTVPTSGRSLTEARKKELLIWKSQLYYIDRTKSQTYSNAMALKKEIDSTLDPSSKYHADMTTLDLTLPKGNIPAAYAAINSGVLLTEKSSIDFRIQDGGSYALFVNGTRFQNPFNQWGDFYTQEDLKGTIPKVTLLSDTAGLPGPSGPDKEAQTPNTYREKIYTASTLDELAIQDGLIRNQYLAADSRPSQTESMAIQKLLKLLDDRERVIIGNSVNLSKGPFSISDLEEAIHEGFRTLEGPVTDKDLNAIRDDFLAQTFGNRDSVERYEALDAITRLMQFVWHPENEPFIDIANKRMRAAETAAQSLMAQSMSDPETLSATQIREAIKNLEAIKYAHDNGGNWSGAWSIMFGQHDTDGLTFNEDSYNRAMAKLRADLVQAEERGGKGDLRRLPAEFVPQPFPTIPNNRRMW